MVCIDTLSISITTALRRPNKDSASILNKESSRFRTTYLDHILRLL